MKLRTTLLAGVVLIAATNAVVLGGAAYNRSGESDAVLKLTQREARTPYRGRFNREDSAVELSLEYRILNRLPTGRTLNAYDYANLGYGDAEWLDRKKLAELGFDLTVLGHAPPERRRYAKQLPKPVFLVLEMNGDAYQASLKQVEEFAARVKRVDGDNALRQEREEHSRLFAIDAGLDAAELRRKYADRTRFAIVHGKVWLREWGEGAGGHVELLGNAINVPLEFHGVIGAVQRFEAGIAFGKRLEPWLTEARATP